jgi:hypothetical protein
MDERTTTMIYEAPALVELGEFGEDTLGFRGPLPDSHYEQIDF